MLVLAHTENILPMAILQLAQLLNLGMTLSNG
jgi:hypothetical protein